MKTLVFLFALLSSSAQAELFQAPHRLVEEGRAAYDKQDYARALELF